jgi:hypothetical protein
LENEYSLGMKHLGSIMKMKDWRPDFYLNLSRGITEKKRKRSIESIINSDSICFLNHLNADLFGERENVHYLKENMVKDYESGPHTMSVDEISQAELNTLSKFWSEKIHDHIFDFHSMYASAQIASYMGFDRFFFLGCDLGYGYHDPHMIFQDALDPYNYPPSRINPLLEIFLKHYPKFLLDSYREGCLFKSAINSIAFIFATSPIAPLYAKMAQYFLETQDPNHASSNYRVRPKDTTWVNEEIKRSHAVAKRILESKGISVYNATIGGELEIYPRKKLQEVI